MDRLLGTLFLIIAIPIILVLALLVQIVDPGPPFFSQHRIGYRGKDIKIWKIRSMYLDSQQLLDTLLVENPAIKAEWETFFKLKNDPRIIPGIGNFMRKFSLDELPQLLSVISGELSLVGPRPFPSYHIDRFDNEFRQLRCSVLPGVTGLWQVSARSDSDLEMQKAIDSYYINNWSIWLDARILVSTLKAVIFSKGAY